MNASYFVLVAAVLTFATGFFVASIVWSIKWLLSPKEDKLTDIKSIQLLHIFSIPDMKSFGLDSKYVKRNPMIQDLGNKELYLFNHGRN